MKAKTFNLVRYDADEGLVFDWATPRYVEDENGTPQPGYTLEFNVDGDILDLM